jgi:uncharacterized protein (TIGR02996 family)
MPTDERELLEAIAKSRPNSDEAHLVYADWLLDRNDPRGELIQVQCALLRSPHPKLRKRERELLIEHQLAWIGDAYDENVSWLFDRGFPTGRVGHTGVYVGHSPEGGHGYARFFPDGTFIAVRTAEPSKDTLELIARWFNPRDNRNRGTYTITFTPGQSPHAEASTSEVTRDSWATDLGHEVGDEYVKTETYVGTLTSGAFNFTMSGSHTHLFNWRLDNPGGGEYRRLNAEGFDSRSNRD